MHKANCQVAAAVTAASWGALQKAFASHSAAKTQTQHASFVIRVQFHRYTGRCLAPAAIHAHLRAFTLSNVYRSQVSSIVQLFCCTFKARQLRDDESRTVSSAQFHEYDYLLRVCVRWSACAHALATEFGA